MKVGSMSCGKLETLLVTSISMSSRSMQLLSAMATKVCTMYILQ